MNEILPKLGELVLGSLPTIVLFALLVIAYGILVRKPLEKALSDRKSRTSGAMEQARLAIATAEAKTSEYENRLRAAKAEVFEHRQQKQQKWNAERDAALNVAREAAQAKIAAARAQVEQQVEVAKNQIETASEQLSAQVVRAVLPAGVAR